MQNNRHAYLILVHNQSKLLQVLIDMIDDKRNDIYIHVDAKADRSQFETVRAVQSRLFYTKRFKVYWGDFSMSNTELHLFEAARQNGPYLYYHILSGVDLPLKNQDYIHHLMDDVFRGKEFVGYSKRKDFEHRMRYYHLFGKYYRNSQCIGRYCSLIRRYAIRLQKRLGVWRNKNVVFSYGPQWVSITDDLCQFILANKKRINKLYHYTLIADESYIQTIIRDTRFYDNIHDKDEEYKSCMRLVDWDKGPDYPHIWTRQDWEELVSSDRLFARKFSEDDMDFIYRLKDYVLNSNTK